MVNVLALIFVICFVIQHVGCTTTAPTPSPSHVHSSRYSIALVGGTGPATSTGNGGKATSATFNTPRGVWIDSMGTFYAAELTCARKWDMSTSIVSSFLGICGTATSTGDGGAATSATVVFLVAGCADSTGKYYVNDYSSNKVKMVSTSGIVTSIAGGTGAATNTGDNGQTTAATVKGPDGLWVNSIGDVYIASFTGSCVRKITVSTQIISTIAGTGASGATGVGGQATAATLTSVEKVWGDSTGAVYLADAGNFLIKNVASNGIITILIGIGATGYAGEGTAATSTQISYPTGMASDTSNGDVYFCDRTLSRVRVLGRTSGLVTTVAGTGTAGSAGDGGAATAATVNTDQLFTDTAGNLYTAEWQSNKYRYIYSTEPTYTPTVLPTVTPSVIPTVQPSIQPSVTPSIKPTVIPTVIPTLIPTAQPSIVPSLSPSVIPTRSPSVVPTIMPTVGPTVDPTMQPSVVPTVSPSIVPSLSPSIVPSLIPTAMPTQGPSIMPSVIPTISPTLPPSLLPSLLPTVIPSLVPSALPSTTPSVYPTVIPSIIPTQLPSTASPTVSPSVLPSILPSVSPSLSPSVIPTVAPSIVPSTMPSLFPTVAPSITPSVTPTNFNPSTGPSIVPSVYPSVTPTCTPSVSPSVIPTTVSPTVQPTTPTMTPTNCPSITPSFVPSVTPSITPTVVPSVLPSVTPSITPSTTPSFSPSIIPTASPTITPSVFPSILPSMVPSINPSVTPTAVPTTMLPSMQPSVLPSVVPTSGPTFTPSIKPSVSPSVGTSIQPSISPTPAPSNVPSTSPSSLSPSVTPSSLPTVKPTLTPSVSPSLIPSMQPSLQPTLFPTTVNPTILPTVVPTLSPSVMPSVMPSFVPSAAPSTQLPSRLPSLTPTTAVPSFLPTFQATSVPTIIPSAPPTTVVPTVIPTFTPSVDPSMSPSVTPSVSPSLIPTLVPSVDPTLIPTPSPSIQPSLTPSVSPTQCPSVVPTARPISRSPTLRPTCLPTDIPNNLPFTLTPTVPPTRYTPIATLPAFSDASRSLSVIGASLNESFKIVLPFSQMNPVLDGAFSTILVPALFSGYFGSASILLGDSKLVGNASSIDLSSNAYGRMLSWPDALSSDTVLGRSASSLGDFNGDGFGDLIIGDPYQARCYVLFGTALGLVNMTHGFTIFGSHSYDLTGWSVSDAGDVNGDHFADVIVGAPHFTSSSNGSAVGAFYVLYGKPTSQCFDVYLSNLTSTAGVSWFGSSGSDFVGVSVSSAGDVNGDGYGDIVVGASAVASYYSGAVHVLYGGCCLTTASGVVSDLSLLAQGFSIVGDAYQFLGSSVSSAGDCNGDGYDDILVGSSPIVLSGLSGSAGSAYVIFGGTAVAAGSSITQLVSLKKAIQLTNAGSIVSSVGDINHDGISDLMIVSDAPNKNLSTSNAGYFIQTRVTIGGYPSVAPTVSPTVQPSKVVTRSPTTAAPSVRPTRVPSLAPTSAAPSVASAVGPTTPTVAPSAGEFGVHTLPPTSEPTVTLTGAPTLNPSEAPSEAPTQMPMQPSEIPTESPTTAPSAIPSVAPSLAPTLPAHLTRPTKMYPTLAPSYQPSRTFDGIYEWVTTTEDNTNVLIRTQSNLNFIVNASLSGGNVTIQGVGGRDKFTILPAPRSTLTIESFNLSWDQIDLSYFARYNKLSDLTITRGSAIVHLPSGQFVRILNLVPSDLKARHFIFAAEEALDDTFDHTTPLRRAQAYIIALSVIGGILTAVYVYCVRPYYRRKRREAALEHTVKVLKEKYTFSIKDLAILSTWAALDDGSYDGSFASGDDGDNRDEGLNVLDRREFLKQRFNHRRSMMGAAVPGTGAVGGTSGGSGSSYAGERSTDNHSYQSIEEQYQNQYWQQHHQHYSRSEDVLEELHQEDWYDRDGDGDDQHYQYHYPDDYYVEYYEQYHPHHYHHYNVSDEGDCYDAYHYQNDSGDIEHDACTRPVLRIDSADSIVISAFSEEEEEEVGEEKLDYLV